MINMILRFIRTKIFRRQGVRSPFVLFLLLLFWSVVISWQLAEAIEPPRIPTVDPVPETLQLGQELYLNNCATCHIAPPPAIFPTETWRDIIQDTNHYGIQIPPLVDPGRLVIWNYLRIFSRLQTPETPIPYRIADSNYFKALHPRVELPESLTLRTCIQCHPGAEQYNFRSLTPEWENAE
jgi:hypothetical protein